MCHYRSFYCARSKCRSNPQNIVTRSDLGGTLWVVAGLSPVLGFQTAAAACTISYVVSLLSRLILHRRTHSKVKVEKEVMHVEVAGWISVLADAALTTLGAVAAGVAAAALG
jgi:hypothetical protein